ncbi:MAG: hypothetical protein ACLFTY_01920 [Candidatus Aenigmatarchaeota archaeon]
MFGKKKGQAAMEYLMTYGWAILAVVIVGGVLYYYGVFEPDLPNQGCPNEPVAVESNAWEVDTGEPASLRLSPRNVADEDIVITQAEVDGSEWEGEVALSRNEQSEDAIEITDVGNISSGDQVDFDVTFTYNGTTMGNRDSACNLVGQA